VEVVYLLGLLLDVFRGAAMMRLGVRISQNNYVPEVTY
jgi:hypothetical protein